MQKALVKVSRTFLGKVGIQVHLNGANTIRSLLVAPKDKDDIIQDSWVLYR